VWRTKFLPVLSELSDEFSMPSAPEAELSLNNTSTNANQKLGGSAGE